MAGAASIVFHTLGTALVLALILRGPISASAETVTLSTTTGEKVLIPSTGPKSDSQILAIARKIQDFDAAFKAFQSSPEVRALSPKEYRRLSGLLLEGRDESIKAIGRAYRRASATAGDSLDKDLKNFADSLIKSVSRALGSSVGFSLSVETRIKLLPSDKALVLQYQTLREYRRASEIWTLYEFGVHMQVGLYVFRPRIPKAHGTFNDVFPILVLNDPTEQEVHIGGYEPAPLPDNFLRP